MGNIVNSIRKLNGVDEILYQSGIVSKVDRIIQNSIGVFVILGFFILLISITLVSNTIRLIVHSKKEDIITLNLLGATETFIKVPFLFEGLLQGFFGSLISIIISYILYTIQIYILDSFINFNPIVSYYILPGNIVLGLILGLIGSYRGITKGIAKYLKM